MRLRVASLLWRSWWRPLCFSGLLLSYWMCHNGRKSNTAWLTMREWKFNSLHSVRAEHPTLYTKQKSVHLCVFAYPRVRSRCMARLPRKISHHWPIKIPLYEGKNRNWLLLKQGLLQYSPGGRHGSDVRLWNTWRDLKNFHSWLPLSPHVATV